MAFSNAAKAGAAVFIGTVQFAVLLIVAEAVRPSYSVSNNYISDLGANASSSSIFNSSIALLGILVLVGAYFFQKAYPWKPATSMIVLTGIGALGVGSFPEGSPFYLHPAFSLVTFLFAGLSALVTARFLRKPLFYFSLILGAIALAALLLYEADIYLGLGPGGMERMIAYPELLWGIGFGSHMMAMDER
jgi:hypothetical membrane protein